MIIFFVLFFQEVGLSYLAKSNLKDDDDDENDGDFKEDEEMKEQNLNILNFFFKFLK